MKELAIRLFLLLIAAIVIIFLGVYFFGHNFLEKDIASMQHSDAIRIALNDPEVKELLLNHTYDNTHFTGPYKNNIYQISSVSEISPEQTGFINVSGSLVRIDILITGTMDYFDAKDLYITVNPLTKKVLEITNRRHIAAPVSYNIIIPPGSSWYSNSSMPLYYSYSPNDTPLYIMQIDGADINKLINGSSCNGSVYDINQNQWVNTSIPIKNNSSLQVNSSGSLPINISNDKYFVFQNGGKYSDISLNFISV